MAAGGIWVPHAVKDFLQASKADRSVIPMSGERFSRNGRTIGKASRKISKLKAISIKLSPLPSANFVKHWSYFFNSPVEVFR
jgi:hypothetical protein